MVLCYVTYKISRKMLYVNIVYTLEREIGGSSCCFSVLFGYSAA